ncbi:MAG TPA: ABC transporter ATP-binding protein [Fimbriimonadaceae bacterium]|nr:ABC transporter ATP-binding protein [Fimbriimonadaceae bacterium]
MALISCTGLGRRFGPRWIVRGVEIEVSQGQVLCVLGSNGSGKSTLLRMLAGLLSPTEGKVERTGTLGYSAIDLAVWPQLSAREHLDLAGELRGKSTDTVALLEHVGLKDAVDQPAGEFSTGMRGRLKLALAIQHSPQILLLDEPSAALDGAGRTLVEQIVDEQKQRCAVVIATNDPIDRRLATHELDLD